MIIGVCKARPPLVAPPHLSEQSHQHQQQQQQQQQPPRASNKPKLPQIHKKRELWRSVVFAKNGVQISHKICHQLSRKVVQGPARMRNREHNIERYTQDTYLRDWSVFRRMNQIRTCSTSHIP
eukprot:3568076-Amphidinium_carterae.3